MLHPGFEVVGQQGDNPVHPLFVLHIAVYHVLTPHRKFGPLQQPGMETGVDAVLHGLGRFHRHPAEAAGVVDHFQKQPIGVGHLQPWGIHFGMDNASFR